MTDFEKAKEISQDCYMPDTGFNREDLYDSAIEMAQWKEEQMIEKACSWLALNADFFAFFKKIKLQKMIIEFSKAMEGNKE